MSDLLAPVLSDQWGQDKSWKLSRYEATGEYQALRKALLGMTQTKVIALAKSAGLRGRGGAGFPTDMKWSSVPQDNPDPKYLVVNADESKPGTCKDMPLLMASSHTLVEGVLIASYAIGFHQAFIYCRGKVLHVIRRLQQAVKEAHRAGYTGRNVLGSGYDLDVIVHAGARAYICGEETALLDSLEGRHGQPRLRPPFPAIAGLYASPMVISNVESISPVPSIVSNGAAWFQTMGTEKSKGTTTYSLSGHVVRPRQFEASMGITLRQLLEFSGGIRTGHELKFSIPGGSSTPILTPEHLDIPLGYEGMASAGTMLGTRALQVFGETTSMVRTTLRWAGFYKHESCGKCTPCHEGSWWLVQLLIKFEAGTAEEGDVDKLLDICTSIGGRSFCVLADGAVARMTSAVRHFRSEFEQGYHTPAWELFPYGHSALFATEGGSR